MSVLMRADPCEHASVYVNEGGKKYRELVQAQILKTPLLLPVC